MAASWAQCRRCIHNIPGDCLPAEGSDLDSSWRSFPTYGWRCPRRCSWWQRFLPRFVFSRIIQWRCTRKEGA